MDIKIRTLCKKAQEECAKAIKKHKSELCKLKNKDLEMKLYLRKEIRMQEINTRLYGTSAREDKDEDTKIYWIIRLKSAQDELAWLKWQLAKSENCILDDKLLFSTKSHRHYLKWNHLKNLKFIYDDKVILDENIIHTRNIEAWAELALFLSYAEHAPFVILPKNPSKRKNLERYFSSLEDDYFEIGETYSRVADYNVADYGYTIVSRINNKTQLSLYFSSLMQIDPLAKLIFLFRIIENEFYNKADDAEQKYSINNKGERKKDYPKYVEYLYGLAKKTKLKPIWVKKTSKKETIRFNIISKWKRRKYVELWNNAYKWWRCWLAHWERNLVFHDFWNTLNKINKINIALTLITRFIIERNNPSLRKVISTKSHYSREEHKIISAANFWTK